MKGYILNDTKTFSILTLGCRVNQYESDCITEHLIDAGMTKTDFGNECDVAIVNTCTVTAESDRKSRQMIRRAVSCAKKVIVTGCYAETGRSTVEKIDGVSFITGNGRKSEVLNAALLLAEGKDVAPIFPDVATSPFDVMVNTVPQRTRSYIKIEDGCDSRCAYCIIPKARGHVRSKPSDVIRTEAEALFAAGCREVILTGIETAAYGRDFEREPYYGHSLAQVIRDTAAIGYERIGLGSLDPSVMNESFVNDIADIHALMPHFHLSVQSGCTSVLARMRRRYNTAMLEVNIARLKSAIPDVTLSADIIVGFPGETEEEFLETVSFIKSVRFLHLHIFPYSVRQGTEAAIMKDQLPQSVKSERLHKLSAIQAEIKKKLLTEYVSAHVSEPVTVLVEEMKGGKLFGHSEHFAEVSFSGDECLIGKAVKVRLVSTDGELCCGEIC